MQIPPNHTQQATGSRFAREHGVTGVGRWYRLEGDARPGDVLALAGGALVRDVNENGLVDGLDARLGAGGDVPATRGVLVDLSAPMAPDPRGALVDVRG